MRCICEALPRRAQSPAHEFHEQLRRRALEVAALAPRYVAALKRRRAPDPEITAMLAEAQARLQARRRISSLYLPLTEAAPPAGVAAQPRTAAPSVRTPRARIREVAPQARDVVPTEQTIEENEQ